MLRATITPETVQTILRAAHPSYASNHARNANHPVIGRLKLGTVFINQAGDYAVYVGVGTCRKRPIVYVTANDRATRNTALATGEKIARAGEC